MQRYRNLLSTLMKKSKQAYYDEYFERNWKGIKILIYLKTVASHVPIAVSLDNGDTITNPYDIVNALFFLLKNEISKELRDFFKPSFTTGVFPSVLKTAKVVPVF